MIITSVQKIVNTESKEFKLDPYGDTMPCSDIKTHRVCFVMCTVPINVFGIMRHL